MLSNSKIHKELKSHNEFDTDWIMNAVNEMLEKYFRIVLIEYLKDKDLFEILKNKVWKYVNILIKLNVELCHTKLEQKFAYILTLYISQSIIQLRLFLIGETKSFQNRCIN